MSGAHFALKKIDSGPLKCLPKWREVDRARHACGSNGNAKEALP